MIIPITCLSTSRDSLSGLWKVQSCNLTLILSKYPHVVSHIRFNNLSIKNLSRRSDWIERIASTDPGLKSGNGIWWHGNLYRDVGAVPVTAR